MKYNMCDDSELRIGVLDNRTAQWLRKLCKDIGIDKVKRIRPFHSSYIVFIDDGEVTGTWFDSRHSSIEYYDYDLLFPAHYPEIKSRLYKQAK